MLQSNPVPVFEEEGRGGGVNRQSFSVKPQSRKRFPLWVICKPLNKSHKPRFSFCQFHVPNKCRETPRLSLPYLAHVHRSLSVLSRLLSCEQGSQYQWTLYQSSQVQSPLAQLCQRPSNKFERCIPQTTSSRPLSMKSPTFKSSSAPSRKRFKSGRRTSDCRRTISAAC